VAAVGQLRGGDSTAAGTASGSRRWPAWSSAGRRAAGKPAGPRLAAAGGSAKISTAAARSRLEAG